MKIGMVGLGRMGANLSEFTERVSASGEGRWTLKAAIDVDDAAEAALMDLHDFEHDVRDGIHVASLAGT